MKAEHLRIGNRILYNGVEGIVYCIQSPFPRKEKRFDNKELVTLVIGGLATVCLEECKPIPLTEEWLLRFGFERKFWKAKKVNYYTLDNFELILKDDYFKKGVTYYKSGILFENKVELVHQLQNLYFCIVGEELTLKN